jgi:hypothetical protein
VLNGCQHTQHSLFASPPRFPWTILEQTHTHHFTCEYFVTYPVK